MKYYKVMQNDQLIGVLTSDKFYAYNSDYSFFSVSGVGNGQFVSINGMRYRDTWMKPITDKNIYYELAIISEITQAEYELVVNAQAEQETIAPLLPNEEEEEEIIPPSPEEIEDNLRYIKQIHLSSLSAQCRKTIENGFDLEIRGETRHFSLTAQDQINLMSLNTLTQTESLIPYHADGEVCEFYTPSEINEIISTATAFKNYHLAYYNSLKAYVNALETVEEISAITYGTLIPEEYKSDVLKVLEY